MVSFIPGNKRYAPPFRITPNWRQNPKAPLILRDARNYPIGSFTRWSYAMYALGELNARAGLPPPNDQVERRRHQEAIWARVKAKGHIDAKAKQEFSRNLSR